MQLRRLPLREIKPAAYNPRRKLKPGDPAWDRLAKAIDKFGMVEPLVWNQRSGNLVGGHQRLNILASRGETEVDVSVVDLDDQHEKALNLALNKQGGEWDEAGLETLLRELGTTDDLNLSLTGFSEAEFAAMCGGEDILTFGEAPESVTRNTEELAAIKKQRRDGGDAAIEKADTEKYLIIVFPDRAAKESKLADLGLPSDERYLSADAVLLELKRKTVIAGKRKAKSAESHRAGGH